MLLSKHTASLVANTLKSDRRSSLLCCSEASVLRLVGSKISVVQLPVHKDSQ